MPGKESAPQRETRNGGKAHRFAVDGQPGLSRAVAERVQLRGRDLAPRERHGVQQRRERVGAHAQRRGAS
eukprot:6216130-Pyramimonas_sp.AAC.2